MRAAAHISQGYCTSTPCASSPSISMPRTTKEKLAAAGMATMPAGGAEAVRVALMGTRACGR